MAHELLLVDDAPDNLLVLRELLEFHGHAVRTATSVAEGLAEVARKAPDLALIDLWLGSDPRGGIEILKAMRERCPMAPAIMISAHVNVERAVQAMELGAFTFLEKPTSARQIRDVVDRGLQYRNQLLERLALRDGEVSEHCLVGNSSSISRLRRKIEGVAATNARALFVGAPGSGREEAARYLHLRSPRAARPFFCISAASAQETVGETALEGGGDHFWPPLPVLRCANGGTLLIEEVERLPADIQPRLRQLLALRLGPMDTAGRERIDVRITASSDERLRERVVAGEFARDLYDRLAVVEFRVPSLSERAADIPALAERIAGRRAEERGWPAPGFTEMALRALRQHDWPGNIRQLRNVVAEAVDLHAGRGEQPIDDSDLPDHIRLSASALGGVVDLSDLAALPVKEARARFEREYFLHLVQQTQANMPKVAELSGMERSALYRKLNSIGIGPAVLARYRAVSSAPEEASAAGEGEPEAAA